MSRENMCIFFYNKTLFLHVFAFMNIKFFHICTSMHQRWTHLSAESRWVCKSKFLFCHCLELSTKLVKYINTWCFNKIVAYSTKLYIFNLLSILLKIHLFPSFFGALFTIAPYLYKIHIHLDIFYLLKVASLIANIRNTCSRVYISNEKLKWATQVYYSHVVKIGLL